MAKNGFVAEVTFNSLEKEPFRDFLKSSEK